MSVSVSDPFNARADPLLPTLALALDPIEARKEFKRRLPRLSQDGRLRLQAIRVTRHKPGRRCVVEFDVQIERPDRPIESATLIGKTRARRQGNESLRLQENFWNAGFDQGSVDGISVPEPLGVISRFQMWFQRKVTGEASTRLFRGANGIQLAQRIADAAGKIHAAKIPTDRRHTMSDELRILGECLTKVAEIQPQWSDRLRRLWTACEHLGVSVPEPQPCGIHRDFYPAQVIVDGSRIYLIDFDLYCLGDPALDIGNFIGHIIEHALRESGNAQALDGPQQVLEERFTEFSGRQCQAAIAVYTTLTLARHIYLSTLFPDRQKATEPLLEFCESRLGLR